MLLYLNKIYLYCKNFFIQSLLNFLEDEDQYFKNMADKLRKIDPRLDNKIDWLKFYEGNRSHVINKSTIFICYRDEEGTLYTENYLIFIMISLLAHTLSISTGHTDEYYSIRDDLVAKATVHGIYDKRRDLASFVPKIIFKVIKKKYLDSVRLTLEIKFNEIYYAPDGEGAKKLFEKYKNGIPSDYKTTLSQRS
jgi:hypothetical protein